MLTSDLVRPRVRSGEIHAPHLSGAKRTAAVHLAGLLLDELHRHQGRTRSDLEEALAQLDVPARELFLFRGLKKLALDTCEFESPDDIDPPALRHAVALAATAARAAGKFKRDVVLSQVAAGAKISADALDHGLFADLKSAQLLLSVGERHADTLVDTYDRAGPQAILLKAERVRADVTADAATFRRVFHRLKFMRLLFEVEPLDEGWRLTIDGPMSMFSAQARYGLKLALALPVLEECATLRLEADVRWGKRRTKLTFVHEGGGGPPSDAPARDEVTRLVEDFTALGCGWDVVQEPSILVAKGHGACIPDLAFVNRATGETVFLEILGYWSRDAVWRRVDLVEAGLGAKAIFAFSDRLRVSEAAVGEDLPAALLSFKGVLPARRVLKALDALVNVDTVAKKGRAKKASAKKASAKKASAKKTSAKKTSAKKTSAKKTSAKKTSAKKTSAKKA